MHLTLNKETALYILRRLRTDVALHHVGIHRTDIVAPDPFPYKRWSKGAFSQAFPDGFRSIVEQEIHIAVPEAAMRIRSKGVSCTVYEKPLPKNSFIDMGDGIAISGPELLFAELASEMHPIEGVMLAHELCGSFSRNADDPRNGPVTYDLKPITSVKKIRAFLETGSYIHGVGKARQIAKYLNDNAWSATESILTAFLRLPIDDFGFDIGPLVLNKRMYSNRVLPDAAQSRVPDILVDGTTVGLNYDGLVHLDLNSIAKAAMVAGMNPGSSQAESEVKRAIADVRNKALDDIRRNRELSAGGMTVLPVLKEDLYQRNGLDQLVSHLCNMLESENHDVRQTRRALASKSLSKDRYRLLLSLLPGQRGLDAPLNRYIMGHQIVNGPLETVDAWIEL